MAAFFGNAAVETEWFGKLYENNETAWYHPWDGRGFLQLTGPDNYIRYWRFRGRAVSDALKSELTAAAAAAQARGKQHNDGPQDTKHPELTGQMVQWSGAAAFCNESPILLTREIKAVGHGSHMYYSCESFGPVAATVNFGSPVYDSEKSPRSTALWRATRPIPRL
jgi:hypothetical protein